MGRIDHLAISALDLPQGVAAVEAALGVPLQTGGKHPRMATHNCLLSLGDLYLEVIAPDPDCPKPAHPRWFDLDRFTGTPRLTNWVAACDDLGAALAQAPLGSGKPLALTRGPYRWDMAVPGDGILPFDGGFPALIHWHGAAHPAQALTDHGIRLRQLQIRHPDFANLQTALAALCTDPRIIVAFGPVPSLRATFDTPSGPRML